MDRRIVAAIIVILVVAGGGLAYRSSIDRVVQVDFELHISSSHGCAGDHPKYGFVYGHSELILRNPDDSLIAKVPLYKSSATNNLYCVMLGTADVPVKDVYRVQIESAGTISNGGLIDRYEVESGRVVLIDP